MSQRTFYREFPAPLRMHLSDDTIRLLKRHLPEGVRLEGEVISALNENLSAHINALRIINATVSDVQAVQEQLDKIVRQAQRVLGAPSISKGASWLHKLEATLTPPKNATGQSEVARHVAIDFLANKFLTTEQMRNSEPATTVKSAHACLAMQIWNDENLRRLCRFAVQVSVEINQTNTEAKAAIEPLIGKLLIDGKPFSFKPDPLREKPNDPKGDALADYAEQMILVYRWMGGAAVLHKDGTQSHSLPPTAFMSFLTVMTEALPKEFRPRRKDALHSRARTYLTIEKNLAA